MPLFLDHPPALWVPARPAIIRRETMLFAPALPIVATPALVLRASATASDTGTITVPLTGVVGDLAALFHCAYADSEDDGGFISNDADPSTWSAPTSNHDTASAVDLDGSAVRVNWKKLTAPDLGASVTVMTGTGDQHMSRAIMLVFSPGKSGTPTYTPGTFNTDANTGNPGSQTVTHSATLPQIIVGFACGPSGSTGAFTTASPAWGGTVTAGTEAIAGYKLYPTGSSPADHSVDMADLGLANFLCSGRFVVT